MSTKSFRDQYSIRQGRITLYRRTTQGSKYQSDSWYAYFKIPNQPGIRRSLKTKDKYEAESFAENLYYELSEKSKRGLSLKTKKFNLVAQSFLEDYSTKVSQESNLPLHSKRYKPAQLRNKKLIINKYLIPFFQEKSLQDITDFDIEAYKEWRKTYWISGPGSEQDKISYLRDGRKVSRPRLDRENKEPNYSTLNKELTVLRSIFEYARLKRMIDGREVPIIRNLRKPKNLNDRKSGLTASEVKRLINHVGKRYFEQSNPKHKRHLKLLAFYIAFMCLTGLRVTESKTLKLSDCETIKKDGKDYLKIFVQGKGKSRELIGLEESGSTLEKIKKMHQKNSKIHNWEYNKNIAVFVDQYGKEIRSFSKGLNRALEETGLLYDKHGTKRNAGAFRKYYITTALLNGVDYFQLAKQCGTSVSVIEKYYSEIETFHQPEKFIFKNALSGVYDEKP